MFLVLETNQSGVGWNGIRMELNQDAISIYRNFESKFLIVSFARIFYA